MSAALPERPLCAACGHRLSLHGSDLRASWCIAWDGAAFCGCQVRPLPTAVRR
jgi:hypothetical protein